MIQTNIPKAVLRVILLLAVTVAAPQAFAQSLGSAGTVTGVVTDPNGAVVPGVVADSNNMFHPLGDHAQTSYSIDNQPVSDQQSKAFSTQLPPNAVQSMEVITGATPAEYGDKTSLVVNVITKSGLGQTKPTGSFNTTYGTFGSVAPSLALAYGGKRAGNFAAFNFERSGRFLDSPEFTVVHDRGTSTS